MTNYRLRKIDPLTESYTSQVEFETNLDDVVKSLIDVKLFDDWMSYRISKIEYRKIVDYFKLEIENFAEIAEITNIGDKKMIDDNSHTGRELLLMIQGLKPLSVFSDEEKYFENSYELIQRAFDKYVTSGDMVKYSYVYDGLGYKGIKQKRLMYALSEETWRIPAYKALWKLADKYGWNVGFERLEGFLLGYEETIDDFFITKTSRD